MPSAEQSIAVLTLLAYLCVAIIGLAYSYEQQSKPSEQKQHTDNGARRDEGDSTNEQQPTSKQAPYWYRFLTGTVAADWALVIVGVVAGIIAVRTLRALEAQVEANTAAANAARKNAAAAIQSAQTAKNHMVLSLRARLGVKSLTIEDFKGKRPFIRLELKNFGGKGAFIYCGCVIQKGDIALPSKAEYPEARWHEIGVQLEAGDTHELTIETPPIPPDAWSRLQSGESKFWVYGAFKYNSGFNQIRTVRYCRVYVPSVRPTPKPSDDEPFFGAAGGAEYNNAE